MAAALALIGLVAVSQLTACAGPSYYSQAISGHLAIMRQREKVDELLQQTDIDPELRGELELATQIRRFASDELGLPANESYRSFVQTGRSAVTWNVVAAGPYSLEAREWCFIVSGCVPYRGYFEQEKAARFADKMRKETFDVTISPAIAYSTLGWFDDPLLDTMFQYSEEQLAAFIFHELAHQMLYVKGDTAFNEGYASFVEETGVRKWLQATGRADRLPQWLAREKASEDFNLLLQQTRARLLEEYRSNNNEEVMKMNKASIFARLETDYLALMQEKWSGKNYFESWFSSDLNNARLALISSYQGSVCAFKRLYETAGGHMLDFYRLASEKAALDKAQRSAWMDQPCESIASASNL
jgi:predicted aminopeptidase